MAWLAGAVRRRVALWAAAAVGLLVWLPVAFRASAYSPRNSDNAWQILVAADVLHGNWKLAGWTLTPYSTWTSEVPVYAAAVALAGLRAELMYVVPPALYLLLLLVAFLLAGQGLDPVAARVARLIALVLLALPTGFLAALALQPGVPHMGTLLGSLGALAFGARALGSTARPASALASAGILFLAVTGDTLAGVTASFPLIVGGVALALRGRRRDGLTVAVLTAAATAAALAAREYPGRHGGFAYAGFDVHVAPPALLVHNARLLADSLGHLLGVDHPLGPAVGWPLAFLLAAAVIAAVVLTTARWATARDVPPADVLLSAGVIADLVAFLLTDRPQDVLSARYVLPAVAMGFVLLARQAGRLWTRRPGLVGAAVGATGLLRLLALIGVLAAPAAPVPTQPVVDWALSHGLATGYAGYWEADLMRVQGRGRLDVMPVAGDADGVHPFHYLSSSSWYETAGEGHGRFLVYLVDPRRPDRDPDLLPVNFGLGPRSAEVAFGPPSGSARIGDYVVLYWDHDVRPLG